jgi:ribosomal protein L21E
MRFKIGDKVIFRETTPNHNFRGAIGVIVSELKNNNYEIEITNRNVGKGPRFGRVNGHPHNLELYSNLEQDII